MTDSIPQKKGPPSLSTASAHSFHQLKGVLVGGGDFDFNLGTAKGKVFRELDEKTPPNFRKFFHSALYDRILQTCLLYFTTMFQAEWVVKTMERSRKQHLEGYNPYVVAARIHELEEETKQLKVQISPIYSEIILKHSTYKQPQQDKLFFESLYETLISLLDDAFSRLQKRPEIEREVGQLFRSKHFNLYKRKNLPPRSVDSLTVKELYTIKHETENRALNAKLLSSLFEKPGNLGVTVASVTNSPLITQYIMSPIVARSMMKDPEARKNLCKSIEVHEDPGRKLGSVFKSAVMLKGVDPSKLGSEISGGAVNIPADAQAALGLMTVDRARKPDKRAGPAGIALPEAAGLPTDEVFSYLTLLKRYIIYGPQLGMAAGIGGGAAAAAQNIPASISHRVESHEDGAAAQTPSGQGLGSKLLATMVSMQRVHAG